MQPHLQRLTIERLRVALVLVMLTVILDATLQFFLDQRLFHVVLVSRVVTQIACLGLLGISRLSAAMGMAFELSLVGTLVSAADVEAAVIASGGYDSSFQTGLVIILVAVGLLFPYGLREIGIACGLVWSVYLAPIVLGTHTIGAHARAFWVNAFFLLCASFVALTASHLTSRLRREEYSSRRALEIEQEKSERLLLNILPGPIAVRLKAGESSISDSFADVTVMFADVVGFTPLSERLSPSRLVDLLNELFTAFDRFSEECGVEKIKTIGDAYMVVVGAPVTRSDHAEAVVDMALDMVTEVARVSAESGIPLNIRIGIHTGPAVAGVIGRKKFTYDLWGDTVNTASRMESHGLPGRIQVSEPAFMRLRGAFEFEERGTISVKGKGEMKTYLLKSRRGDAKTTIDDK